MRKVLTIVAGTIILFPLVPMLIDLVIVVLVIKLVTEMCREQDK